MLRGIETRALALRGAPPPGNFNFIDDPASNIGLPTERPLHHAPTKAVLANGVLEGGAADLDVAALFSQVQTDRATLAGSIRQFFQTRARISLLQRLLARPLQHGLTGLLAYLQLAGEQDNAMMDESMA